MEDQKMKTIYDENMYVWVIFTPNEVIFSHERAPITKYFKKLTGTCELCSFKNGNLDENINEKFGDNWKKDMEIIQYMKFDFPFPNHKHKHKIMFKLNGKIVIKDTVY